MVVVVILLALVLAAGFMAVWLVVPESQRIVPNRAADIRAAVTRAIAQASEDPVEQARLRLELTRVLQEDDRRRSDLRAAMFQLLAGSAVIIGGASAWVQLRQFRADRRDAQDQTALEAAAQAVDQLASDRVVVRMGGIATLGDLPRLSESRLPVVIDLLTAFVREYRQFVGRSDSDNQDGGPSSGADNRPQPLIRDFPDVQLALNKLIALSHEGGMVLAGARLRGAEIGPADLHDADLRYVDFSFTDLNQANLRAAYLVQADLENANLRAADLTDADLKGAREFADGLARRVRSELGRGQGP